MMGALSLPACANNDKSPYPTYAFKKFQGGDMQFYSFWRSLAAFRVRIALNVKGIVPDEVINGPILFQSIAIIEYLEETRPEPPLLPKDPRGRARVRALSAIVASDSHPLVVPSVRNFFEHDLKLDMPTLMKWIRHWVNEGLGSLEGHLARDKETGKFAHGDAVTMADLCLVSQVVSAGYFEVDTSPYPTVKRIAETCLAIDAFARAHPMKQPGAPATLGH
jgi:maleylacetoacetate isomerase